MFSGKCDTHRISHPDITAIVVASVGTINWKQYECLGPTSSTNVIPPIIWFFSLCHIWFRYFFLHCCSFSPKAFKLVSLPNIYFIVGKKIVLSDHKAALLWNSDYCDYLSYFQEYTFSEDTILLCRYLFLDFDQKLLILGLASLVRLLKPFRLNSLNHLCTSINTLACGNLLYCNFSNICACISVTKFIHKVDMGIFWIANCLRNDIL